MAMDKINGSTGTRPGQVDQYQSTRRGERAEDGAGAGGEASQPAPASGGADTAEISAAARRMADLRQAVDVGRAAMGALPEVREDVVQQVRRRLQEGYYQSVEVTDTVAQRLAPVLKGLQDL